MTFFRGRVGRHPLCRIGWALTALPIVLVVVVAPGDSRAAASHGDAGLATSTRPRRVLVLSLPATTWADLAAVRTPNLSRLLDGAGVADLSTRATGGPRRLGDGYATLSAGTRSATDGMSDGNAFEANEPFGQNTAAATFHARTGRTVRGGLVQLGLAGLVAKNAGLLYDAKLGALGDALAKAGFARAVIANSDSGEPVSPPLPQYRRNAVTGLMGSEGTVPDGAVGPELLESDPSAPFGVRLSADSVERAFQAAWRPRSVVLVEASDLARADAYKPFANPMQWARLRRQALAQTDALVGKLLSHVDLRRDAVVVFGPVHPANASALTIAALRAPGVPPGLLRSATTRRTGFASLWDLAPTVLDTVGVRRPASMEGRPLVVASPGGTAGQRRASLIADNRHALFRDDLLAPATFVYIVVGIALALAMMVGLEVKALRPWLRRASLAVIGYLIATYLAALIHFDVHGGQLAFWCFVVAAAIAFAGLFELAGRAAPVDALMWALGALVVLHVADSFAGARAELNSVFGNSATVGIRFAGLGNMSFAQLAVGAIGLAGLLAWRIKRPRGVQLAIAVLGVSLLALAPPIWGQNFGATISAAPAFVLLGWLLLGRAIRPRTVLALAGVLVGVGVLTGIIDLLRPSGSETHVGRFFETIGGGGSSSTLTVLHRKADEAIHTLAEVHWLLLIAVVLTMTVYLYVRRPAPLRVAVDRIPTIVPSGIALGVVAGLGLALNDSGISIPGMMLGLAGAAIVYLATVFLDHTSRTSERVPAGRESTSSSSMDGGSAVPAAPDG